MDKEAPPLGPGVYLVATPIGNMEDITLRALRVLASAEALACEDTRVTRKLFQRHGLPAPKALFVANDHNERTVAKRLVGLAAEGKVVAFCSDAGMPGISDPGFNIARAAREAGVAVEVVPGASAVVTAVALSGIPAASFTFLGFPPRRDGRLADILREHGALRPALVFYESPRRLARLLSLAAEHVCPDRQAAVCLELTKKFERVSRGTLEELAARFAAMETKGEAVVIIEGAGKRSGRRDNDDDGDDGDEEEEFTEPAGKADVDNDGEDDDLR